MKSRLVLVVILCVVLKNSHAGDDEWWKTTSIYEIYIQSFKDSNKDGVGDLNGIYENLDYIKDLGIETIWITPFYKSSMDSFGYDVIDFTEIDPLFGTMDDFKILLAGIHERGMKLITDLVPNHMSYESDWFKKSVNRQEPYTDFFIWHDGKGYNETTKTPLPPNNWLSIFGGTAWEWNDRRKQFYYKLFSETLPDLNYRNPKVREAIKNVLRFWLDLGVDGFRLDAVRYLMEVADFRDEPYVSPDISESDDYSSQMHIYTADIDETYEITHEWRLLLDEYEGKDNRTRIMCSEAYTSTEKVMKYFGNETYKNVHIPFNFRLVELDRDSSADKLNSLVHDFIDQMPPHGFPNWQISNHDNHRLASRTSPEFSDAMNMVALLLPGVVTVYYGDEIGMEDTRIHLNRIMDVCSSGEYGSGVDQNEFKDGQRAPMQWDDSKNSGFTNKKVPWMPLNTKYWFKNVQRQLREPKSHLKIFKRIMQLRNSPVIKNGDLNTCVLNDWVFTFVRSFKDELQVVVIVNMGSESEVACASNCFKYLPDTMYVHTGSLNAAYNPGDKFFVSNNTRNNVTSFCSVLRPKAGVVLTTAVLSSAGHASFSIPSLIVLVFLIIAAENRSWFD